MSLREAAENLLEYKNLKPYNNPFQKGSPRLYGYDYSSDGYYFITICTKDRHPFFGKIEGDRMIASEIGKVVITEWNKTRDIRKPSKVYIDEFCLMPNHIHGIIRIGDPDLPTRDERLPTSEFKENNFGPQSNNLSSIIRGFKSTCTKQIRGQLDPTFQWQRRFYDHIVRDLEFLENIRKYIRNKPANWKEDELM